jgi:Fe-S cluster assembly protein SufD
MHSSTNLQAILPGVLCDQQNQITVREMDDVFHIHVAPQANQTTQLCFVLRDEALNKKYQLQVDFHEPHARVEIRGLYQLTGKQFVEIESTMNHAVSHCESMQIWKGVLKESAKAKLEGKIIVFAQAQKSVAHLKNKNLLLSKTAEVNTKPTLEIYADDVQCSHGATVGFLDEQALFYLRSRGIDENAAREMLIDAFTMEIIGEE